MSEVVTQARGREDFITNITRIILPLIFYFTLNLKVDFDGIFFSLEGDVSLANIKIDAILKKAMKEMS